MSLLTATLPPPYPSTSSVNKYFFYTVITNRQNITGIHWTRPMATTINIGDKTVEQPIIDSFDSGNDADAVRIRVHLQTMRRVNPELLWFKYPRENGVAVYHDFPYW